MIIHVGLNKPIGYLGDLCLKSKEIQLLYMIVIIVIILIFARPPHGWRPGHVPSLTINYATASMYLHNKHARTH